MDIGVVIIVVVAIVGGVIYDAMKMRYKYRHLASGKGYDELQQEMQAVKERLATLESIVTDKKYQLKEEINRL
jgi:membrane protein insertase Oxa1/YidC/SpoIIIJ